MDADALIKLTKASLKEDVLLNVEVHIPPRVEQETVNEGKAGKHADAFVIEKNVQNGRLHISEPQKDHPLRSVLDVLDLTGGEAEVLELYAGSAADLIISDDTRFLRLLDGLDIPFATPTALVVALVKTGRLERVHALKKLDDLAPHVSESEIVAARESLMEGHP